MNAPRFRSTAAFAHRQRAAAPTVDRATFVIFSLGQQRYAVPVELVERVLRVSNPDSAPMDHAHFAGRDVRLIDLASALRAPEALMPASNLETSPHTRVLIFALPAVWVAAVVDVVHEVATIDASTVAPITRSVPDAATFTAPGVRGHFTRADQTVLVLDMIRVMRTLFERAQAAVTEAERGRA